MARVVFRQTRSGAEFSPYAGDLGEPIAISRAFKLGSALHRAFEEASVHWSTEGPAFSNPPSPLSSATPSPVSTPPSSPRVSAQAAPPLPPVLPPVEAQKKEELAAIDQGSLLNAAAVEIEKSSGSVASAAPGSTGTKNAAGGTAPSQKSDKRKEYERARAREQKNKKRAKVQAASGLDTKGCAQKHAYAAAEKPIMSPRRLEQLRVAQSGFAGVREADPYDGREYSREELLNIGMHYVEWDGM